MGGSAPREVTPALGMTDHVYLAGIEDAPELAAIRFREGLGIAGHERWCAGMRDAGSRRGGAPWSADGCHGKGSGELKVLQDAVKKIPGKVRPAAISTMMMICHDEKNQFLLLPAYIELCGSNLYLPSDQTEFDSEFNKGAR